MSEKNILNNINNQSQSNLNIVNATSDKILINNQNLKLDIMQFKDEILREIKLLKKSITEKYDFTNTLMNERFVKYDNKLTSYSDRINEISQNISINDKTITEIKTLTDFKNKFRDSMLTMDIKINNMERETKNNIFRIDNILTDSVIYPGIIGKSSRFKTFHQMVDYILSQVSQNLTYREKNTLDVNQIKKKISTLENNIQSIKENINKEIKILLEKKLEESDKKLGELISEYNQRLTQTRAENAEYIKDIQATVHQFKAKLEEFEIIKNKISEEIKEEGRKLKEENEQTQNIFKGYKKDFNLMKDRFTQLSEFIKDVRFRINLGQEVKRREYFHISSKIDFSKKQKVLSNNNIKIYNTKYQKDSDIPDFLQNNHYSPNANTLRSNIMYKEEDNTGQYSTEKRSKKNNLIKKIKNRGRNDIFDTGMKEGRNLELNFRENKTNKTSDELYEENDKYNKSGFKNKTEEGKYYLLKNVINNSNKKGINNSDSDLGEIVKRRNTANIGSFHVERFKKLDSNNERNGSIIKEILEDTNIIENKKDINKNFNPKNINLKDISHEIKENNKYKILNNNNILNYEDSNDSIKNKLLFLGLKNKDNAYIKNFSSSLPERINIMTSLDENSKLISPKSKFTSINDLNINRIESKNNSRIFLTKKTTVKSLTRIQSALTPKYPNISNSRNSLKNSNSLNALNMDHKTTFEEDKMSNTNKNHNLNSGFIYNSHNRIKSYLSPNVRILQQHSVEHLYENKKKGNNDFTGMINNLTKYINGYSSNNMNKKEIKIEQKRRSKNSEYFKLKEIVNGNINEKRYSKNKANVVEIGFNEIK